MLPEGLQPESVCIVMICEAPPADPADAFYAPELAESPYRANTLLAFTEAGASVRTMADLTSLGVYLTYATKVPKTGNAVDKAQVGADSAALERELDLLPGVQVYLLMGDVAISAFNGIARRRTGKRVIPAGSTYKLRAAQYSFEGKRVIPSYLQTGGSYLIEKFKRQVVAEDLHTALQLTGRL